jgi:DNA-directed RNA polymerase specialized sigma subunit
MQTVIYDNKALLIELENWGWWAQDDEKLGFGNGHTSGRKTIHITDTRALEIDRAIASFNHREIKAMKLRFICGFGQYQIGNALNISEGSASRLVDHLVEKVRAALLEVKGLIVLTTV